MKEEEFVIKLNEYLKSKNCKLIKYTTIEDMLGNLASTATRYTYIYNDVVFEDFTDFGDINEESNIFNSVRIQLERNINKLKENL